MMQRLRRQLQALDGQTYKAYKSLAGDYRFDRFQLRIDHVQGDPFAEPSRIRLQLPAITAALPTHSYSNTIRRIALEDYLARAMASAINACVKGQRGSGNSGMIRIAPCTQQVLQRDAVAVREAAVELRMGIGLPARDRRIDGQQAAAMLFDELPQLVAALCRALADSQALQRHLDCVEDQQQLRSLLAERGWVAFIADGSLLARRSGIDNRPLLQGARPFRAPDSLAATVQLAHAGAVRGLPVAEGVTVIVGGGFHGKSTLLQALQSGVYNHVPGDGRERVVSCEEAVKVRAEDGRIVQQLDISRFINHLPLGLDTRFFSSDNASGSVSQAANIIEAMTAGSRCLLIDEDTSATNFMIRDRRMQAMVAGSKEPISPLVDHVQGLYRHLRVSTVLVTGGSSAYFDVADRVLMMDCYQPVDVAAQLAQLRRARTHSPYPVWEDLSHCARRALADPLPVLAARGRTPKLQAYDGGRLRLGNSQIDLARVEQLVCPGQMLAIGYMLLRLLAQRPAMPVLAYLTVEWERCQREGLEQLSPYVDHPHGALALPRRQDLYAALNRWRDISLSSH